MIKILFCFLITASTVFAQNIISVKYSLFNTIDNDYISPIKKSNSIVHFDFDNNKITLDRNNKKEVYKITSHVSQGVNSNNREYSEVVTEKGGFRYLFRITAIKLMIMRMDIKTGIILYN